MFPKKLWIFGLMGSLMLVGCHNMKPSGKDVRKSPTIGLKPDDKGKDDNPKDHDPEGVDPEVADQGPGLSQKAELRFKKQSLLKADLSAALDMKPDEMCQEFGKSCLDDLYNLSLGGVDAYHNQITKGLQKSAVTTPVVLERVVLSACSKRAKRDIDDGEGVIFKFKVDGSGKIPNIEAPEVAVSLDNLYKRAMQRPIEPYELKTLLGMYTTMESKTTEDAAEKWAALSCYAVLTSLEAVFY